MPVSKTEEEKQRFKDETDRIDDERRRHDTILLDLAVQKTLQAHEALQEEQDGLDEPCFGVSSHRLDQPYLL